MTALRVSRESALLLVPLAGDGDCPYAAIERVPIKAINSDGNALARNPLCLLLMRVLILQYARSLLAHPVLVALVAQVSPSRNDDGQCRDGKDDSNTQCLIMNWEIIRRSGWKERYHREA